MIEVGACSKSQAHQPAKEDPPAQSCSGVATQFLYKNWLQEATQRLDIPLPIYSSINEGFTHAPKFRATVSVNGTHYTSAKSFVHRKAAEQDAARVALLDMESKFKNGGLHTINQTCTMSIQKLVPLQFNYRELVDNASSSATYSGATFCKAILNEYAVKMKFAKPTYTTVQPIESIPAFQSTVVINGVPYTGDIKRNKKEAEKSGARAAILSILESDSKVTVSEIINSKCQTYASSDKWNSQGITLSNEANKGKSDGEHLTKEKEADDSILSNKPDKGKSDCIHLTKEREVDDSFLSNESDQGKSDGKHLASEKECSTVCKCILNEYAAKLKLELPTYSTIQPDVNNSAFKSSLVFNGVTCTGEMRKKKKDAEQSAAHAVILFILESDSRNQMLDVIKSNGKLSAAWDKLNEICNNSDRTHLLKEKEVEVVDNTMTAPPGPSVKEKEIEVVASTSKLPMIAPQLTTVAATPHPPFHQFRIPKQEPSSEPVTTGIVFVPPTMEQSLVEGSSSGKKRNRKNKNRARKKAQRHTESQAAVVPGSQAQPCSVSQ